MFRPRGQPCRRLGAERQLPRKRLLDVIDSPDELRRARTDHELFPEAPQARDVGKLLVAVQRDAVGAARSAVEDLADSRQPIEIDLVVTADLDLEGPQPVAPDRGLEARRQPVRGDHLLLASDQ